MESNQQIAAQLRAAADGKYNPLELIDLLRRAADALDGKPTKPKPILDAVSGRKLVKAMEAEHATQLKAATACLCGVCHACDYVREFAGMIGAAIKGNEMLGEEVPKEWREAVAVAKAMKSSREQHADSCELTLLGPNDPMARCNCAKPQIEKARQLVYELLHTAKLPEISKLAEALELLDGALLKLRIAPNEEHAR